MANKIMATVIFGAIAIISVEENNNSIKNFEDAMWFSVTTLTISGFGDVVPVTTPGRIVATILSFIGLGIILGFLSNVGRALVTTRLGKTQKRLHDETKQLIINKIDDLEQLRDEDVSELVSAINSLYQRTKSADIAAKKLCSGCQNVNTVDSLYCNKCGSKIT